MKLTEKKGKYTFTMPDSKVTVTAEFAEIKSASTFADVPADAYYAKAVEWAVESGVTNGTSASTFSSGSAAPGPRSSPSSIAPIRASKTPGLAGHMTRQPQRVEKVFSPR